VIAIIILLLLLAGGFINVLLTWLGKSWAYVIMLVSLGIASSSFGIHVPSLFFTLIGGGMVGLGFILSLVIMTQG
jgi:hypothetical protein